MEAAGEPDATAGPGAGHPGLLRWAVSPERMQDMNRKCMVIAAAVLMALPGALALAQEPAPTPAPSPRARARTRSNVFTFMTHRGRIGVIVNTRASADSDKIGARL